MVVMFVDCCVCVVEYFSYYSYSRNPTGREFFVPAGTLIAVNLLKRHNELSESVSDTSERLIVKQKTIRVLLDTGLTPFCPKRISKLHTNNEVGCSTIVGHFKWHL